MRRSTIIIATLLLLSAGAVRAQDKLVRYDEKAFEKLAKEMNEDKNNPFLSSWAKDVFRTYCELKSVKVEFTEQDFKNADKEKKQAEANYDKLLAEKEKSDKKVTNLEQEKAEIQKSFKEQKGLVDSLNRVIKSLNGTISGLQKNDSFLAEKERQLKAKDGIISIKDSEIAALRETVTNQDGTLGKLAHDTAALNSRIKELTNELTTALDANKTLDDRLNEKDRQIDALNNDVERANEEKVDLNSKVTQYEKAFESTKTAVSNIYDDNKAKRIIDMDISQLAEAQNAWDGMKTLIESANPILANELKQKVDEINNWKSASQIMREAKAYLKGKYDDKQRRNWIGALEKIKLTGDKTTERDDMLTMLNDEQRIKENFDQIMRNLAEKKCLPMKEKMEDAYEMVNRMTKYVKNYYHASCYDSYDQAIKMIEDELTKSEPSSKIDNNKGFAKFIEDLRIMF